MKDIRLEVSARVYRILLEFMHDVGIRTFGIKSRHQFGKRIITIYTNCAGLVIGHHGEKIGRLNKKIHEDNLDKNIDIELEEVDFFIRNDNEPYTDKEFAEFMNEYLMAKGL